MSRGNVETASDLGVVTNHSTINKKRSFLSKIFRWSQPKSNEERDKLLLDFIKRKDNELKEMTDQKHRLELQCFQNQLENEKAKLKYVELKNLLESKCELLRTENLAAKEESERLRGGLRLTAKENLERKIQLKSLEEKLAAESDKFKKKCKEFEDLNEVNRALVDELRRQKSDFERERYELTHPFIPKVKVFIPSEVLCEIFEFCDRKVIETRLRLVCRRFSEIITRYFAKTPPYFVLDRVVIVDCGFLFASAMSYRMMPIDEFWQKWLHNFPRYLRTLDANLELVDSKRRKGNEQILSAVKSLWDGYEFTDAMVVGETAMKFATVPSLTTSLEDWTSDESLFVVPAVHDCAGLVLFVDDVSHLDADEVAEWILSHPKYPHIESEEDAKNGNTRKCRSIMCFNVTLGFRTKMFDALERKISEISSQYATKAASNTHNILFTNKRSGERNRVRISHISKIDDITVTVSRYFLSG